MAQGWVNVPVFKKINWSRDVPGSPVVKTHTFNAGGNAVQFLARELRSHIASAEQLSLHPTTREPVCCNQDLTHSTKKKIFFLSNWSKYEKHGTCEFGKYPLYSFLCVQKETSCRRPAAADLGSGAAVSHSWDTKALTGNAHHSSWSSGSFGNLRFISYFEVLFSFPTQRTGTLKSHSP